MGLESGLSQYRAFIPESISRGYRSLNDANYQDLLSLMRDNRDIYAFEILESKVVVLGKGVRQEQQQRQLVKLTTNSNGELCYLYPPKSIRLVSRDSKPLYLPLSIWEDIELSKQESELRSHKLQQYRRPVQNAWGAIMREIGAKEEAESEPGLDRLEVSFVMIDEGKTKADTINLYIKAITSEINDAATKARGSIGKIFCNGLIKKDNFVMNGIRVKLEKLGYKVHQSELPEGHNGKSTYKRILVEKRLK